MGEREVHLVSANRDHFNASAQNYKPTPSSVELAKRIGRAIRRVQDLDEDGTEVMDFACGAGLLSQQLAPYVKTIVGVDISQGMVDLYNNFVSNQGVPTEEMQAICVDLLEASNQTGNVLQGRHFDVITCAMAYHHFPSIADATRALTTYLKPTGTLIVVDLMKSEKIDLDELFPEHQDQIVAHRGGFTEDEMTQAFAISGLHIEFQPSIAVKKKGRDLRLIVAKGIKS